jgi:methionyl-tRNA formyltransferase
MDSGDILLQEETLLGATETYGELHDRLAQLGATLIIKTIEQVVAGTIQRQPQDASGVTFAQRLKTETGKINWQDNVFNIVNLIRGLSPSPAAYTHLEGQVLKIFSAEANQNKISEIPGTVGAASDTGLPVAASDGYVILKDIQLAGKKRMLIPDFLRGHHLKPGTILQ